MDIHSDDSDMLVPISDDDQELARKLLADRLRQQRGDHRGIHTTRQGVEAVPFQEETKDIWWIRPDRSDYHPCPFPLEIPDRLIRLFTLTRKHTPIILDFCLGSGTTAVAAKQLGRKFIGIEISEKYCAIAVQRLAQGVMAL